MTHHDSPEGRSPVLSAAIAASLIGLVAIVMFAPGIRAEPEVPADASASAAPSTVDEAPPREWGPNDWPLHQSEPSSRPVWDENDWARQSMEAQDDKEGETETEPVL